MLVPRVGGATTPKINGADTAWVLASSALVLMMTIPGLALFYGGMVRRKNVLVDADAELHLSALVSIQWVLFGYSLAFSPGSAFIGGLQWVGLAGVSATQPYAAYSATVPHQAYMILSMHVRDHHAGVDHRSNRGADDVQGISDFQPAVDHADLRSAGALGVGLRRMDSRDGRAGFRRRHGGAHLVRAAALAGALLVGKRRGYPQEHMAPHNLTLTITGAGLLWVGWFGFNAGSSLAADGLAVSAFVATHLGAAAATLSWVAVEWFVAGKPTVLGAAAARSRGWSRSRLRQVTWARRQPSSSAWLQEGYVLARCG